MATTAGTTGGFKPYSSHGSGGQSGHSIVDMPITSGQTVAEGDVLIMATGKVTVDNAAAALIVGVAVEAAAVSTGLDTDKVAVALALPGALFIGTLTGADEDTNEAAPTYGDITQGAAGKDIEEHANGHPVIINDSTTDDVIYLVAFANEQFKGANYVNTTTVNPRVIFQFNPGETIFEPTSA